MKAKVILTSTALLGMLSACSQDELAIVETNAPAEVGARRVAGNVVLNVSMDGATRFDKKTGAFTPGDKIGVYLMDKYNGENEDANSTQFNDPSVWWSMFSLIDNIHTNYLYKNVGGQFVNPGTKGLVEGNYFFFYDPESSTNDKAYRNQRDLWKAMKKSINLEDFTDPSEGYNNAGWGGMYGTLDNQFYLDYQMIYRDQPAVVGDEGVLDIDVTMKQVLPRVKTVITNNTTNMYKFKEIRITPAEDEFVPNIAYVRPESTELQARLGDDKMYQGKTAFTQEMARQTIVWDDVNNGYVPYGYEGDYSVAPYYSVIFPENAILNAHSGNIDNSSSAMVAFPVPMWGPNWANSTIRVYADKYDPSLQNEDKSYGVWVPGYFEQEGSDNGVWTMDQCFVEGNTGRLNFDNFKFIPFSAIPEVETTQELYDRVKAILSDNWQGTIEATLAGDGIEINEKLNTLINTFENKYNKQIKLQINPNGHNITLASENMLNDNYDLKYPKNNPETIIIAADQKLEDDWTGKNFTVEGDVEIDLNGHKMGFVSVAGKVTLPTSGIINGTVDGEMIVEQGTEENPTVVEVGNSGLLNTGKITVEGILQEKSEGNKKSFTNNGEVVVKKTGEVTITDGEGILDVSDVIEAGDGAQKHIEIVKENSITVIDNVTYSDYKQIQARLEQILAAHNLTGDEKVAAINVTSSAGTLSNTASEVKTWADIVSLTMEKALTSAEGDFTQLKKLTLSNGAVVAVGKTLAANDLEIDGKLDVRATATVKAVTSVELNADVKLYENANLVGEVEPTGDGKVYGYDSQIGWTLTNDQKQGNE